MNIYDKLYDEIQRGSYERGTLLARKMIKEVEEKWGISLPFSNSFDSINRLFALLSSKYQFYFLPLLEKYAYNPSGEIQHIMKNIGYWHDAKIASLFPSCLSYQNKDNCYILDTVLGKIQVYYADQFFEGIDSYVLNNQCHASSFLFVHQFEDVSVSTALIDLPLGGKHYHSFVNYEDGVIDLAHNAYMSRRDYELSFHPDILNTVTEEEIAEEEEKLEGKESLSQDKHILLRLALDKQVKRKS